MDVDNRTLIILFFLAVVLWNISYRCDLWCSESFGMAYYKANMEAWKYREKCKQNPANHGCEQATENYHVAVEQGL